MKKLIFVLLVAVVLLVGCDPVQDDLISYINDGITPLSAAEEEVIYLYESVTGDNYTDDWVLYDTIVYDIIPKYQVLINDIEAVRPATDEVRGAHEIYIRGSNIQYNAMLLILDAIEYQDYATMAGANNMLSEARSVLRDYHNEIDRLAQKHNVIIED